MITKTEAEAIASKYLAVLQVELDNPVQLTKIQEEPFGWVFFYQSADYIKTGNLRSMLAGNAPFIVDGETGSVHVLGTAYAADVYIREYAKLHG